ncbi:MAG TPA: TIGR00159 family protein [Firmicutes bacterium]|jgi:diadenylate cyclase|nr:TIGR00159 family protein [Bacillota bacterium]
MLDRVWQALQQIALLDFLDIIIVYYVIYRLLLLIRDTRAVQLIKGLVVLLTATVLSGRLRLWTLNWLLNRAIAAGFIAVPIVFWPELRRGLEQLGRTSFFGQKLPLLQEESDWEGPIHDLVASASILSKNKIGALVVIERETGLNEYVETGTLIDALVSKELLTNTFIPNTPLHDGAVIIRNGRMLAAGCYLPLSSNPSIARELGTRHRAAIGVTEETDAIAMIVSEETGIISIAVDGEIERHFDTQSLQEKLEELLLVKAPSFWNWRAQKDD